MRLTKLLLATFLFTLVSASASASVYEMEKDRTLTKPQKIDKQEDRLHKKIYKIQNRIIKAKEKAGEAVLDDAGFLADADDRVRWGLVGLAGGILLTLILTSSLKWIGTLGIIGGLGLLIWYLIDP